MEQISVEPRHYPGYIDMEKEFPCFAPLLIRSAENAIKGTLIPAGFYCTFIKAFSHCALPSPLSKCVFSFGPVSERAEEPGRGRGGVGEGYSFFFFHSAERIPCTHQPGRKIPIEWITSRSPTRQPDFPAFHTPAALPGSRRRTGCRSISPVPTEDAASRACAGSRSRPR